MSTYSNRLQPALQKPITTCCSVLPHEIVMHDDVGYMYIGERNASINQWFYLDGAAKIIIRDARSTACTSSYWTVFPCRFIFFPLTKTWFMAFRIGQWLKWSCEAGVGAHLTKPGWSKPHNHSTPN